VETAGWPFRRHQVTTRYLSSWYHLLGFYIKPLTHSVPIKEIIENIIIKRKKEVTRGIKKTFYQVWKGYCCCTLFNHIK